MSLPYETIQNCLGNSLFIVPKTYIQNKDKDLINLGQISAIFIIFFSFQDGGN